MQSSAPATVTLIVNTPPVAVADQYTTNEDVLLVRSAQNGVRANDTDADGNPLTVQLISGPQHGTLTLAADGSFTYQPALDYSGPDSFSYQLTDGIDLSEVAVVSLHVNSVDDAPIAGPDTYYRPADTVFQVAASAGLLVNDTDVDSSPLTAQTVQGPSHGTLQLQPDGGFVYTPNPGFVGTDSFQYAAHDGNSAGAPAGVTLLVGAPPVKISEFLAANGAGTGGTQTRTRADATANFRGEQTTPDWIELMNVTTAELDISGFHLTDARDTPTKWTFPAGTTIPAGGYLVVYADNLEISDPALDEDGRLHTNFKLDVSGEYVAVTSPNGDVLHAWEAVPEQRGDVSYGLTPDGLPGYLLSVTPGAANVGAYAGRLNDTVISVPRGLYEAGFPVQISSPDVGVTIRYTLDGSEPTLANGLDYAGPITINGTTVLKSASFRDNYLSSDVSAQSYIFPAQVLQQDQTGIPGAVNWGHRGPDWAMDPTIVNHEDPEVRPELADFERIPTVSVAIDPTVMFGRGGIYIQGENIEKAMTFEFFDPTRPDNGIQTNSTIQIVGGSSPERWKSDKLSMRVRFTEDEGESQLDYPVFGTESTISFDTLVLDARLNNVWHYGGGSDPTGQRARADYLKDEFASDLQNALGGTATHGQHVHLYINGIYWGMHMLHERPDDDFAATYLGGDSEDYDVIKHSATEIVSGSNASFLELNSILGRSGNLTDEQYQAAAELLDIDDFINYMLVNFYGGNADWDQHNWYASRNRVDGKWRFHSWDAEKVLESASINVTTLNNPNAPTGMHRRLATHPEYLQRFADLVQKHFYHDGALTPEATAGLYLQRANQIDLVMRLESARWGDNQIDNGLRTRYTRLDWLKVRDGMVNSYFPQRSDRVLTQFVSRGWFKLGQGVEFSVNGTDQYGGSVLPGSELTMSAAEGTIFYSTDGTDPRQIGGEVSPAAHTYGAPLTIQGLLNIKARLRLADGSWGPLADATFTTGVPADGTNLRISEIHYHPADVNAAEEAAGFTDADEFEFIELVNISNRPIDLAGVRFEQMVSGNGVEGVAFDFSQSAVRVLAPGQRVVVVENLNAFTTRYGADLPIAGAWDGGLSNSTERIRLMAHDQLIAEFAYSDRWVASTDGDGNSLQAVNEAGSPANWGTAAYWKASTRSGGSPGTADGALPGDSNHDGIFNSSDLVAVFQAGKYEDGIAKNATFEEGDWDGDGDFTTADLVFAFQNANYIQVAVPAALPTLFGDPAEVAASLPELRTENEGEDLFAEFTDF